MNDELSGTQKMILPMLTAGKSYKDIAYELNVTCGCVSKQISRMRGKLGRIDTARPLLTDAEQEVARRLAQGYTFARVACDLGVQLGTVCGLAAKVYKKYGIHRKADLRNKLKQEASR